LRFNTLAAKTYLDGRKAHRPLSTPLVNATTFQVEDSLSHGMLFRDGADSVYQRFGHPTVSAAGEKIARLEGAEAALVFSSGMGAITSSLSRMTSSLGVETEFVVGAEPDAIARAIRPDTKLIYVETPSNPLLHLADIRALGRIAGERGLPLFVDSTFASPYLQNPLSLGASLSSTP